MFSGRKQLIIIALALVPHVAVAAYLGGRLVAYPDQDAYLSAARNLLDGRGLSVSFNTLAGFVRAGEPTSYYGFGAPALLAAQMALFGENYFALRVGNILLFAASLFFFRGICRQWMPEGWANAATAAMALSPFYVIFNQLFLTEMPFLCCELGAFYFLFKFLRRDAPRDLVLAALFIGLSLLVRTNLMLFLPVVAVVLVVRRRWTKAVVYVAVAGLVVLPYCVRNCVNNRAFFPFDGKAALNLWQFNADVHRGGFWVEKFEQTPEMPSLEGLTEKERADLLTGVAAGWIREHPGDFLRLAAIKAVGFFSPLPQKSANSWLAPLLAPYALLMLAGFFVGATNLSWRDPEHLLVILLLLYTLAIEMVFMYATRHRILFDPFFLLVGFRWASLRWASTRATADRRLVASYETRSSY